MTYGELKETEIYINAEDVEVCVNGEEPIDEEYFYVDEICLLDTLPVVGMGHFSKGILQVDLVCSNWDKRFDEDWMPENNAELLSEDKQKDKITLVGGITCSK